MMAESSATAVANSVPSKAAKPLSQEEIYAGFQQLRAEQKNIALKINELEMDASEHALVIDVLNGAKSGRTCFRMVGGVLVERTVGEVLPSVKSNNENIKKLAEVLKTQLTEKGVQIQEYMARHNIQVRGPQEGSRVSDEDPSGSGEAPRQAAGILVQ